MRRFDLHVRKETQLTNYFLILFFLYNITAEKFILILCRGGVLEDVLGLEDTFRKSCPWPWPQILKSSKIALASARGQNYFLNR